MYYAVYLTRIYLSIPELDFYRMPHLLSYATHAEGHYSYRNRVYGASCKDMQLL